MIEIFSVKLVAATLSVWATEGLPKLALKAVGVPVTARVGSVAAMTLPATATVLEVAPALESVTSPTGLPDGADALMRTLAVPPVVLSNAVLAKVMLSEETSKSAGAVTVTPSVKFVPLTEIFCEAEAVPLTVENAVRDEVVVISGSVLVEVKLPPIAKP